MRVRVGRRRKRRREKRGIEERMVCIVVDIGVGVEMGLR